MLKNSRIHKWIIIIVVIVFLFIIGGVVFMVSKHHVSIRGQHLNQYQYSSGGGMDGGYNSETVKRYDDIHARIAVESAEWHSQDPEVKEYLVDVSVLDELEGVVRKYRMNFWNRKEFSKVFICDGESIGYNFRFDENDFGFSSQVYPAKYRNKLRKFDEIIEKYLQDATVLPGLINTKKADEENYDLPEGELELYVYYYCDDDLGIRILNGKDEETEISRSYKIINNDTNQVIAEENSTYTTTVYPKSRDEMSFSLTERLGAGHYKIILGEIEIPFIIE